MAATFRRVLKDELARRLERNARYSLRSFARDLGLAPSRVSEILRGKNGLSAANARKITQRLGWSAGESAHFCDLVALECGRSPALRATARERLRTEAKTPARHEIELDAFRAIADWYHMAILELAGTADFRADDAWIAQRLDLDPRIVAEAVERLVRLGMITRRGRSWRVAHAATTVGDQLPSEAVRAFHRQVLQRASLAVDFVPMALRHLSASVVAIPAARVPHVVERIRAFRRELSAELSAPGVDRDAVYCLAVQLFPLTHVVHPPEE